MIFVVGVNFFVDPYGITGAPRLPGFNQYKVDINKHVRLMKKYNPLQNPHNAVIVGNSRVEMGVNPSHACFQALGMKVYNLGIPGASVRTQLAYALNLIYQQNVDTVFLSLDVTDFIWTRRPSRIGDVSLLEYAHAGLALTSAGTPNPAYRKTAFLDYYQSLFSLDSLAASIRTVAQQSASASDRDDAGFNPARDFAEAVRVEGTRALFDQKIADLEEHFSKPWYLRDANGRLGHYFDDLRVFLNIAGKQGVSVYLFVNPFHDSYWTLLKSRGHFPLHHEWLAALQALIKPYPKDAVVFWDFSVESPFIHEAVPQAREKAEPLKWFWEPSHYRQQLGDLMIDTMLSDSCGAAAVFGRRLH